MRWKDVAFFAEPLSSHCCRAFDLVALAALACLPLRNRDAFHIVLRTLGRTGDALLHGDATAAFFVWRTSGMWQASFWSNLRAQLGQTRARRMPDLPFTSVITPTRHDGQTTLLGRHHIEVEGANPEAKVTHGRDECYACI